jgi:uncharacterized protein (UPF0179 family)
VIERKRKERCTDLQRGKKYSILKVKHHENLIGCFIENADPDRGRK